MREEMLKELTENIIPYWKKLKDERGGFYGHVDFDLNVERDAPKGVVLHSRILWFFSNAYIQTGDQDLLPYARHAYEFLINHCLDKKEGGVYWMLDCNGFPLDETKHGYNQAFAIYALSSYYNATNEKNALDVAYSLYNKLETATADEYGYAEAFTGDWKPTVNTILAENDLRREKTTNNILHIMEAYTEFYRTTKDPDVADKLTRILDIFRTKIYNPDKKRFEVFFDSKMNSLNDMQSYGHDIETFWLIDRACEVLENKDLTEETRKYITTVAQSVLERAFENGSLLNECFDGVNEKTRIWWVQAEAIVGFNRMYKITGETKYIEAAHSIWKYIKEYIIDKRPGGEWYQEMDDNGVPSSRKPITSTWKCPYHNGRMCIEMNT